MKKQTKADHVRAAPNNELVIAFGGSTLIKAGAVELTTAGDDPIRGNYVAVRIYANVPAGWSDADVKAKLEEIEKTIASQA